MLHIMLYHGSNNNNNNDDDDNNYNFDIGNNTNGKCFALAIVAHAMNCLCLLNTSWYGNNNCNIIVWTRWAEQKHYTLYE